MAVGILLTRRGYNIVNNEYEESSSMLADNHIMIDALTWPYLAGAKMQIARYKENAELAHSEASHMAPIYTNNCFYEAAMLFECLDRIARYCKMKSLSDKNHDLWIDIRNHITHDIRENFDKEAHVGLLKRAMSLKIQDKYRHKIVFEIEAIIVGGLKVELDDVAKYLKRVEAHSISATIEHTAVRLSGVDSTESF